MKLSIIIPVYNAENKIEDCITSAVKQDLDDYEIIIINDGSTDSSKEICEKYAGKYANIILVNQENQGVSASRNAGLQIAKGKYITFLDSDDQLVPNTLDCRVDELEVSHAEMSVCNYQMVSADKKEISHFSSELEGIISVGNFMESFAGRPTVLYYGVLWNKIYKKDIIRDNNISFDKNISLAEDFLFNLEYLKYVKNVLVQNNIGYLYTFDENTESLSKNKQLYDTMWEKRKFLNSKFELSLEFYAINKWLKYNYLFESFSGIADYYINVGKYKNFVDKMSAIWNDQEFKNIYSSYKGNNKKYLLLSILLRRKMYYCVYLLYKISNKIRQK